MAYSYKYPRPAVTADCVVFSYGADGLEVLLVERGRDPFQGHWAFPGGFMEMEETAGDCARRELLEETGIRVEFIRQVGAFSTVSRDPRGRTISIVFYTLVRREEVLPVAGDDAARVGWFVVDRIPSLAFDHGEVLAIAMDRLVEGLENPNRLPLPKDLNKNDLRVWIRKHWRGIARYDDDFQ